MKEKSEATSDITKVLGINKSAKKRVNFKKWIVWGVPVLLAVIAVVFVTTRGKTESVQFKTKAIERGDLSVIVTATGNLEPTNQVDVGSELSGIIKKVNVDYNDHVKVGQVLAKLDTTKLEAAVRKSKASLESAKSDVLQAQATYKEKQAELERMKKVYSLSGGKVPSKQDMDTAEAELERAMADKSSALAQVSQAQASLESDETDLTKAAILSPINGIVLVRDIEPGQTVAASLEAPVLFTLAEDLTKMELHVDIDEADVGEVKKEQTADFTVDAYPNKTFPAHISQVRYGSEETDGVVTYKAVLTVDNSDLLLRPGMTATADITVSKVDNALLVPNAALRFVPPAENTETTEKESIGGNIVNKIMPRPPSAKKSSVDQTQDSNNKNGQRRIWIMRDGAAVPIYVTTGMTNGINTEIKGGDLQPGMAVIVATMSGKK
jgi:HlyD family secretion protein